MKNWKYNNNKIRRKQLKYSYLMCRNCGSPADDSEWDTAAGHERLFYASENAERTLQSRV